MIRKLRLFLVTTASLLALGNGPLRATLPSYDHIVVVVLENHGYHEILNGPAPWINFTLRPQGANLLAFGLQHPSQPNYYWLFSGSNQGILNDNFPPSNGGNFTASCLYTTLIAGGKTFGGYVEAEPFPTDFLSDLAPNYVPRHVPWLGFSTVPAGITKSFAQFPQTAAGFAALPTVSFVIPGLNHDMHDYQSLTGPNVSNGVENAEDSVIAIQNGDLWLRDNLSAYLQWARTHNSLLILTTDEDSTADWVTPPLGQMNPYGLTSPLLGPVATPTPAPSGTNSGPNQITTIIAGAGVIPGNYSEGAGVTNVNVLRTIEALCRISSSGAQSPLATEAGITNLGVSDIFASPVPSVQVNGPRARRIPTRLVSLSGTAFDAYGTLEKVQVQISGRGPFRTVRGTSNWSFSARLPAGRNVLFVRAIAGNHLASSTARIVVVCPPL